MNSIIYANKINIEQASVTIVPTRTNSTNFTTNTKSNSTSSTTAATTSTSTSSTLSNTSLDKTITISSLVLYHNYKSHINPKNCTTIYGLIFKNVDTVLASNIILSNNITFEIKSRVDLDKEHFIRVLVNPPVNTTDIELTFTYYNNTIKHILSQFCPDYFPTPLLSLKNSQMFAYHRYHSDFTQISTINYRPFDDISQGVFNVSDADLDITSTTLQTSSVFINYQLPMILKYKTYGFNLTFTTPFNSNDTFYSFSPLYVNNMEQRNKTDDSSNSSSSSSISSSSSSNSSNSSSEINSSNNSNSTDVTDSSGGNSPTEPPTTPETTPETKPEIKKTLPVTPLKALLSNLTTKNTTITNNNHNHNNNNNNNTTKTNTNTTIEREINSLGSLPDYNPETPELNITDIRFYNSTNSLYYLFSVVNSQFWNIAQMFISSSQLSEPIVSLVYPIVNFNNDTTLYLGYFNEYNIFDKKEINYTLSNIILYVNYTNSITIGSFNRSIQPLIKPNPNEFVNSLVSYYDIFKIEGLEFPRYLVSTILFNVSLENVKDASLINYGIEPWLTSKHLSYPYGYSNGTLLNFRSSISTLFPRYCPTSLNYIVANISSSFINIISGNTTDELPPVLHSISFIVLDHMNLIIRINVSDDYSGFHSLVLPGLVTVTHMDFVSGTYQNGIFETIFNYYDNESGIFLLTICDNVRNVKSFEYYIDLPIKNEFNISDSTYFTKFEFKYNNIELTDGGTNILYFNYTNANPNLTPAFKFIYSQEVAAQLDTLNQYEKLYWDDEKKLFSLKFNMPSSLLPGVMDYSFIFQKLKFNPSSMASLLGLNSILYVKSSKNPDQFPPIISNITQLLPYSIKTKEGFVKTTFGWELIVIDQSLDSLEGLVHVTSEYDLVGFKFNLFPNSSISRTADTMTYNITFSIIDELCRNQTYRITKVWLMDSNRQVSSTDSKKLINPFFKLFSTTLESTLSIKVVNCSCNDTIAPEISPMFPLEIVDVASDDRNIFISFNVTDNQSGVSIRHVPMIYLENSSGDRLEYLATIANLPATNSITNPILNVNYNTSVDIPYGFGYPNGIIVSIYGISDNCMNINGYSAGLFNYNFSIIQVKFNSIKPIIENYSPITEKGGVLTLYGRQFGINSENAIIQIDYLDGNGFQTVPASFVSGIVIKIDVVKPTIKPFNVRVIINGSESNTIVITPHLGPVDPTDDGIFTCPGDPICGGPLRGECDVERCKCYDGWTGVDCTSNPIELSVPKANTLKPSVTLEENSRTAIMSILSLREIDQRNDIVREVLFTKDWEWLDSSTSLTPNRHIYMTNFTIENQDVFINVTTRWYTIATDVAFANRFFTMKPSSIKYFIKLSKYPFQNTTNHLQLVFSSSFETSQKSDLCSVKRYGEESLVTDYVKLQINDKSLFARYIKRAVLDGKVGVISNTVLDSVMGGSINSSQYLQTYLGINIPFYKSTAEIDPDFTIISETLNAKDYQGSICTSSRFSNKQIIGIIIGIVMAVLAIVLISGYFIYKRFYKCRILNVKMKKLKE